MRQALILVLLLSLVIFGCTERFSTNPAHQLILSIDTLTFDTVFANQGSATARFLVYNPHKENLRIESVALRKGGSSPFKINVDGETNAENSIRDIEISGKDSLYVFVKVFIDPTTQNTPVLVTDELVFSTNGNNQTIHLEAYGQDVEVFRHHIIRNDTILRGEKPYLIYGYLAVDSAKTLVVEPGTVFYCHNGAQIVVRGNLIANGTIEQPIVFRGSRLDNIFPQVPYLYVPGQWDGIYLDYAQGRHEFHYVEVRSGNMGIVMQNRELPNLPHLTLKNSRIHNANYHGLVVQNGNVEAINTEISNCGSHCVYLAGGTHLFVHNTIANYFGNTNIGILSRVREQIPALLLSDLNKEGAPMNSTFLNCIITGNTTEEFGLATTFPELFRATFSHNYMSSADSIRLPQFSETYYAQKKDTVFQNNHYRLPEYRYFNFELSATSPARNRANRTISESYMYDRNGKNRLSSDGAPDLGAYEWIPTTP